MESVVKARECQWCHKAYYLSDGRYKYCSDECAEEARRARCGKNSRTVVKSSKPVETPKQSIRIRLRDEYWRRCLSESKNSTKAKGTNISAEVRRLPDWLDDILKRCKQRRKEAKKLSAH